jgi:hypothetical protein
MVLAGVVAALSLDRTGASTCATKKILSLCAAHVIMVGRRHFVTTYPLYVLDTR